VAGGAVSDNLINLGIQSRTEENKQVPLTSKQMNGFLFAIEGVGAVFVGIFLSVYVAGLKDVPMNVVYHSEPFVRGVLSGLGAVLLVLALAALIAAYVKRKS
jgi:hypothetical protein